MYCQIYGLWRIIRCHEDSLEFPCRKSNRTNRVYSALTHFPIGRLSCPLAHNCFLALLQTCKYHLLKHHLLFSFFFFFIPHAQTVFTLDSCCVKLVVEEVKNQLFEGTSKWPMAADSWGLVDPHYVL